MDDSQSPVVLIATVMIVLLIFVMAVFVLMIIYRKHKLQHFREITLMNERFNQELLQAKFEMQQQTIKYVGSELHDFIGNRLSLAFLYAQKIPPEAWETKAEIEGVLNESLDVVKSLYNLTLPDINEDLDVLIKNESDKVQAAKRHQVEFHCMDRSVKAPASVKYFVLRIVQEFLHNSINHSSCEKITIQMSASAEGIELKAADNGRGFLIDEQTPVGLGLTTMKKRANLINARFDLVSTPGNGTQMRLYIPQSSLKR